MDGFTTRGNDDAGLAQAERLPGIYLPVDGSIVPFNKEGNTVGYVGFLVAAVIDDDVDTTAFTLPLEGIG